MSILRQNARKSLAALAVLTALGAATAAPASGKWVIKGHGFGHGVGMSAYGAYGYAKHGWKYKRILKHYYSHTKVQRGKSRRVRVLLDVNRRSIPFRGAQGKSCGKKLHPSRRYAFTFDGGKVKLRGHRGKVLGSCGKQGSASGGGSISFGGKRYRGSIVGYRSGGAMNAINALGVDAYVKGVVPSEIFPSWPAQELRTQAVASRTFALSTKVNGDGFQLYSDTRSQVYGGRSAETKATNRAVDATRRQIVTYHGKPIVAYFFSTSGGRTEAKQFGFPGSGSSPYLRSVRDPYDKLSPLHNWTKRLSNSALQSKLGSYARGKVRRIKVLKHGFTPRIVKAKVIGSRGSRTIAGDELRFRLGLYSTWARFKKH